MQESNEVWFATSNEHKFEEARFALKQFNIKLKRLPTKGLEIQSNDVSAVARRAALEAYTKAERPLFVEDTGLFVTALNGFPGPYAAYVDRTIGPGSLLTLLRGTRERGAEFVSAVAFCRETGRARIFTGRLRGHISSRMRGTNGFGFDPVFIPDASDRTLAEMTLEEKGAISHRSRALKALGEFLESYQSGQPLSA